MNYQGLFKFIQEQETSSVITELMQGRRGATPNVTAYRNCLDPATHRIMDPKYRPDKWVRDDSGDGIDCDEVGDSKKGMKIVKVGRIPLALQRVIVERAVSFAFGKPAIVSAEVEDGSKEEDVLKAVKAVLRDAKTKSNDRKVARELFSTTEVAELWYPVEYKNDIYGFPSDYKLRMAILSPINGDRLYPYFDEFGDMVAFSRDYHIELSDNVDHEFFETWTKDQHIKWEMKNKSWEMCEGFPTENPIGKIPIVYGQQPEVEWNAVQHLIERLEVLLSNFADTNDYHSSPKIFVTGNLRGFAQKGETGAIIEGEEGASAQYLSWQQAPEAVRLEIETLTKMIYTLTQTPDISWDSVKGLNVSGITLKMLFLDAHLKVQSKAEIFDAYMSRRAKIIQAYLASFSSDRGFQDACNSLLVDVTLQPYMINDDSSNVSMLMAATGQKAIMARKTAIQQLGIVNDIDAEIQKIQEEESGAAMADIFEPTE